MEALSKTFKSIRFEGDIRTIKVKEESLLPLVLLDSQIAIVADAIKEAGVTLGCDRTKGNLMSPECLVSHL